MDELQKRAAENKKKTKIAAVCGTALGISVVMYIIALIYTFCW